MVALWASVPWWLSLFPGIGSVERRGQFGDSFGSLNALFSGLAFLGVIYAIRLQSKELKTQQRELKLQRRVLVLQQEELEGQKGAMQKKTFERTFFQLLNMLEKKYDYIETSRTSIGTSPIGIYEILDWVCKKDEINLQSYEGQVMATKTYFLLLFKVLKFIDESTFCEDEEKKTYVHLLRDQMSESVLRSFFLLSMEEEFCEKCPEIKIRGSGLRDLIEDYTLFQNVKKDVLLYFEDSYDYATRGWPTEGAFGDSHPEIFDIKNILYSNLERL